tara:strand:+ start:806 stop:1156 length:351 start_codon:yes stop_codon:yes gene_type:complete
MPSTTKGQKGTAMDYLSAPRSEGIVKELMMLLGYEAPKGGRLPAGVKYDTLKALVDCLGMGLNEEFRSMLATRVVELQSARRKGTGKVSATPESIVNAIKSGKISLEELKAHLDTL